MTYSAIKTGDFDLNSFLSEYKPKNIVDLSPYLNTPKLNGYKQLDRRDMRVLVPNCTYVKYIRTGTEYMDKKLESHIKGGILVNHGTYINGKFVTKSEPSTHMMLRTAPFKVTKNEIKREEGQFFIIKNLDSYIFYKKFEPK